MASNNSFQKLVFYDNNDNNIFGVGYGSVAKNKTILIAKDTEQTEPLAIGEQANQLIFFNPVKSSDVPGNFVLAPDGEFATKQYIDFEDTVVLLRVDEGEGKFSIKTPDSSRVLALDSTDSTFKFVQTGSTPPENIILGQWGAQPAPFAKPSQPPVNSLEITLIVFGVIAFIVLCYVVLAYKKGQRRQSLEAYDL